MRAPLGMAYYRAGRFAEQVEWLKPHEEAVYFSKLWSALGYHHLGQTEKAKQLLQQADAGIMAELTLASLVHYTATYTACGVVRAL